MNNFAIISSLNMVTIGLLGWSIFVFWKLIIDRMRKSNDNLFHYILNNDSIRSPFGYTLVAIGFLIRIAVLIPLPFFGELKHEELVAYWEFYVKMYSQFFSSAFVFFGIALLMWPTLRKYYVLITKRSEIDDGKIVSYYLLFCLLFFGFGVLLHEGIIMLLR